MCDQSSSDPQDPPRRGGKGVLDVLNLCLEVRTPGRSMTGKYYPYCLWLSRSEHCLVKKIKTDRSLEPRVLCIAARQRSARRTFKLVLPVAGVIWRGNRRDSSREDCTEAARACGP